MPYLTASDGTRLFYVEHGHGQPVLLVASWAFSSDMWDRQVHALVDAGLRCVAVDRRGHGRSDHPASGYDLDTTAGDLHTVIETMDLQAVHLVGHSVGAAEVVRYLTRHGEDRVASAALVSSVLPWLVGSPHGPDAEQARANLDAFRAERARWFAAQAQLWLATHLGNRVDQATIDWMVGMGMSADPWGAAALLQDAGAADHTDDLRAVALPTLVVHGSADHVVPAPVTGQQVAQLVPGSHYREYPTAGHGLFHTHADELVADLLGFWRGLSPARTP